MVPHAFKRWMGLCATLILALTVGACTLPGNNLDNEATPLSFEGAPNVTISSPAPNATYLEGTDVNILARIENAGGDVARVEIKLDDTIIGQGENPNPTGAAAFTITNSWPATLVGQYTLTVSASRADGTTDTAEVVINVRAAQTNANTTTTDGNTDANTSGNDTSGDGSQPEPAPTTASVDLPTPVPVQPPATPQPADPATQAPPTAVPPTATPSVPTARIIQGANVRSGPGTAFTPPIGSLAANETAEILARNPAGDWYKIRYYNGEAWVFSSLIEVTGNTASLPVDVGPPTPVPATATPAVTATPTPAPSNVNLFISGVSVSPHPLICGQTSTVSITISNGGSAATAQGGRVRIQSVLNNGGASQSETFVPFGTVAAGGAVTVSTPLTVSTNVGQAQDIRVTIDDLNEILESNEQDNVYQGDTFVLGSGSC